MILDVGCGIYPKGNVNVDLMVSKDRHNIHGDVAEINPHLIPNFIKADASHLPFKTKCFSAVVSYHTLEHIDNPESAVKEMFRVSKANVKIVVPYWLTGILHAIWRPSKREWLKKHHKRTYNRKKVLQLIKPYNSFHRVYYRFISLPHALLWKLKYGGLIFPFPWEIVCEVAK